MMQAPITDWDDAYSNGPHIPDGDRWPDAWVEPARAFRESMGERLSEIAYGEAERERLDLFVPQGEARGLVVFVHGGYWMKLDKSFWSHFAAGPLARGWAVAMPSYTLAPDIRIGGITRQIARAVEAAAGEVAGPIRLAGHSAGGQIVTRLACDDDLLAVADRVERVVSISGLHDLRPLLRTGLNETLGLDAAEAASESPALLAPRPGIETLAWVGQAERSEFVRQSALLANVWRGLGVATELVVEPDRHHFNVIDGLADPDSALVRTLLA